jgi:hypothetical protein
MVENQKHGLERDLLQERVGTPNAGRVDTRGALPRLRGRGTQGVMIGQIDDQAVLWGVLRRNG